MTDDLALPPPADNARVKRGGGLKWVFTLFLLTLLAVVTGAGFGLIITSRVEKQVEARLKAESDKSVSPTPYTGDVAIQKLPAVVSNMSNSGNYWVRIESSIVY